MVDVNIGNFITIGLISVVAIAALSFGLKAAGVSASWL